METDPFEVRRRGAGRLRVVTATVGAAALVGTGALTYSMAAGTASAGTSGGGPAVSNDGPTTPGTTTDDGGLFGPVQSPQVATPGNSHASSGGS